MNRIQGFLFSFFSFCKSLSASTFSGSVIRASDKFCTTNNKISLSLSVIKLHSVTHRQYRDSQFTEDGNKSCCKYYAVGFLIKRLSAGSLSLLHHLSLQSEAQRELAVQESWKYLFDVPGWEEWMGSPCRSYANKWVPVGVCLRWLEHSRLIEDADDFKELMDLGSEHTAEKGNCHLSKSYKLVERSKNFSPSPRSHLSAPPMSSPPQPPRSPPAVSVVITQHLKDLPWHLMWHKIGFPAWFSDRAPRRA